MLDNSFVVQIISLFSILIILIIDFFGFKKKKIFYSFIGIIIVIFSSIEASDSFKSYEDKDKSIINEKKENVKEQTLTNNMDIKKEISTDEKSQINNTISNNVNNEENANPSIEKNNAQQQIDEKNIKNKQLKKEIKQYIKQEIKEEEIKKQEKIEKINSIINENYDKISESVSIVILLGDNIKNTEKWQERVISKIWKIRELCAKGKEINHPKELDEKYNIYLGKINKIELILNSLESGIVNDDKDMIRNSFQLLRKFKNVI